MSSLNLFEYFKELPSTTIVAFVKQQSEMSEGMKDVYQRIKDLTSAEIRRLSEEEVLNINNTLLSSVNHVFVFDHFTGNAYDHLVSKKCENLRIFGVPLVAKLIADKINTSVTKYCRIHNDAFQDLNICTSNLNSVEKGKIENLIKIMNGKFTNDLSSDVTHLITNSTKTVKYFDACTLDIPIYHTEWVYHIWNKWQKQQSDLPKANSAQYDVFKLPPLFDLKITATGMSKKRKEEIADKIEENGGKFEEVFKSNETDILLMDNFDPENSKLKAALKHKIPVLSTNYVIESVKSGCALSYNDFAFKRPKSLDSSSSSSVSMSELSSTNVSSEEVIKKDTTCNIDEIPKPKSVLVDKTNDNFLLSFTIGQAKKLGHILDGYVFYFYNFPTEHYFKVGKLISTCGGIRITELDQSITHILCYNNDNIEEFHKKSLEKGFHGSFVDYKWLIESLKQGDLLSESDYIINVNASSSKKVIPPSPLSKKAINSLNVSIKTTIDEKKENNEKSSSFRSTKKESTSSKMLDFSNHELIQPSIEANHKKIKQPTYATTTRKRSYESDSNSIDETSKRRKINDGDIEKLYQTL